MEYKGYKALKCYIEACMFRKFISTPAEKFLSHEKFLLTPQTIDSLGSIVRSMAEVYGRYTYSGTRNFFIIPGGSVTERMENLATAFGEGYMAPGELTVGEGKCELAFTLTNGYISSLDRVQRKNEESNKVPNSKLQIPKT